jgi:formyltetrahydrofolate synthetase
VVPRASLHDMRSRLGRIVLGQTYDGQPVTAEGLHAAGAMTLSTSPAATRIDIDSRGEIVGLS